MGKVISQMMVSLDGFIEGRNQELNWHQVDDEYHLYAAELLDSIDIILFGRKTYQHMENFWPSDIAKNKFPVIADRMNQLPKIVFSRSLENVDWENTMIVKKNICDYITEFKQYEKKNIVILGSAEVVSSLTNFDLIDEYQVIINPVILGGGKYYFNNITEKKELKLVNTKVFQSGNVLLCYEHSVI